MKANLLLPVLASTLLCTMAACGSGAGEAADGSAAGPDSIADVGSDEIPASDHNPGSDLPPDAADVGSELLPDQATEVTDVLPDWYEAEVVVTEVPMLLVDSNRDGLVTTDGADDSGGSSPALLLVNADDDDSDGVRDCDDEQVNGPQDEADLASLLVKPLPDAASATLEVTRGREQIRIFRKVAQGWTPLPNAEPGYELSQHEMTSGLTLGVEALRFRGEEQFDGQIELTLSATGGDGETLTSTARMLVAPLLLTSGLDPADVAYAAFTMPEQEGFMAAMEGIVQGAGAGWVTVGPLGELPMVTDPGGDIWFQDAVEIGWSAFPGPNGPVVQHVAIQAPRGNPLDQVAPEVLLGPDMGLVVPAQPRSNTYWFDWFGNLETSPPLTVGTQTYPHGRIYVGHDPDDPSWLCMHPDIQSFLTAQQAQGPLLLLDTGWLLIGHVDEMVSWIPVDGGKGFKMLIASTQSTIDLLEQLQASGHASAPVFAGKTGATTVGGLLSNKPVMDFNKLVQPRIDANRELLKKEFGLNEEDIIDVPCLFTPESGKYAVALMPDMVNSLVLGHHFISPDPFGPVVDGKDAFKEALRELLEPWGVEVHFVDNWYPYHSWSGEIHCGTNARRLPEKGGNPGHIHTFGLTITSRWD